MLKLITFLSVLKSLVEGRQSDRIPTHLLINFMMKLVEYDVQNYWCVRYGYTLLESVSVRINISLTVSCGEDEFVLYDSHVA